LHKTGKRDLKLHCTDWLKIFIKAKIQAVCNNFTNKSVTSKTKQMKSNKFKKNLQLATISILALSLGACNRGVGCPSDFSLSTLLEQLISIL
jgi:hypothetical protein